MTVYNTSEGDGFVELCTIIYEPDTEVAPRPFVISYATADDTAGKCIHHNYFAHSTLYFLVNFFIIVAPEDYKSDSGLLRFDTGDDKQCHSIQIVSNEICEEPELEHFFSNLTLVSGIPLITVDPDSAKVIINDTNDCSKCTCMTIVNLMNI